MLKTLKRAPIRIGPEDNGKPMTLDEFDPVLTKEGYFYELSKGVIEVSEIPKPEHAKEVQAVRDQFVLYRNKHPDRIVLVAGSNEAKLLIEPHQSERHPDVSIYTTPQPRTKDVWSTWVPTLVVEVVSSRSAKRDYQQKPEEYRSLGIREYWIIDSAKGQMTVFSRFRGSFQKQIVKPPTRFKTPMLPGFSLDLKRVLSAAKAD